MSKNVFKELYDKYSKHFPADLWAYAIMMLLFIIAAIFIL